MLILSSIFGKKGSKIMAWEAFWYIYLLEEHPIFSYLLLLIEVNYWGEKTWKYGMILLYRVSYQ